MESENDTRNTKFLEEIDNLITRAKAANEFHIELKALELKFGVINTLNMFS